MYGDCLTAQNMDNCKGNKLFMLMVNDKYLVEHCRFYYM
jgi:hypothetical protein